MHTYTLHNPSTGSSVTVHAGNMVAAVGKLVQLGHGGKCYAQGWRLLKGYNPCRNMVLRTLAHVANMQGC